MRPPPSWEAEIAQVPYSGDGPNVAADSRAPDDLERLDVRPDQFGAAMGQGLQQLGQGVEQAVKFHDQVSVDDQVNKVMSAADIIRRGDPNGVQRDAGGQPVLGPDGQPQPDLGYLGMRGEDAMHARPQVLSSIDQTIAAARANLTSPEAQLQFDQQTRRMRSGWANEVGDHAEKQSQVWGVGVQNSAADLAKQQITASPSDPEQWKHALADLVQARVRQSQLTYGNDPTAAADAARKARAEGAVTQVEALLNRDPSQAKQVLEGNRAGLDPQVYDQLVNRLRPMLAGDQTDEAIRRAAAGQPVAGGPVQHTPPAGGSPLISDADNLAAEKRLSAGIGTDADRALRATYLQQQNTPPRQQPRCRLPQVLPPTACPRSDPCRPRAATADPRRRLLPARRRSRPIRRGAAPCRPPISRSSTRSRSATRRRTGPMSAPPRPRSSRRSATAPRRRGRRFRAGSLRHSRASPRPLPLRPSPRRATPISSPASNSRPAEAAAQIRDRKPTLSDADKAADAADQQLLDRYKASHGIPRTTGIDVAKLPDDPPQAVRDTSPEPVPHPDTHVLPSHPYVAPGIPGSRVGATPSPVPGGAAAPFFAQIGAPYGISGNYLARTKQIESGSGSGVGLVSPTGAAGAFQFTRDTARRYGLVDPNDLKASADAAARLAADNKVGPDARAGPRTV